MAELNLKQITDKLNAEFSGENRKLVFWYDDHGDFATEIESLELTGAKLYLLEPDNQFQTKYFLEWVDTTTSQMALVKMPLSIAGLSSISRRCPAENLPPL